MKHENIKYADGNLVYHLVGNVRLVLNKIRSSAS